MSTGRETEIIPAVVPVFPLPNVVLFPGTVVPLHVFEPRYREMVRDASQSDGMIGLALLEPGFESDYDGQPAFHPVGTVGRLEDLDPLPDGRYNVSVAGLQRVEYHEIPSSKPYRLSRVTPMPELAVDDSDRTILATKRDLLVAQAMLLSELKGESDPTLIIDERLSFSMAVNGACANLPVASEVRQELLAVDCLVERSRRAGRLISGVLQSLLSMKSGDVADDARPC
jgi:Lon protease-like protein